jgi:hypothetical protein
MPERDLDQARRACAKLGIPADELDRAAPIFAELYAVEQMITGGSNLLAMARLLDSDEEEALRLGMYLANRGALAALRARRRRDHLPYPDPTERDGQASAEGVVMGVLLTVSLARLGEAEQMLMKASANAETVICCDCQSIAGPRCGYQGHGVVTLGELLDSWSNP